MRQCLAFVVLVVMCLLGGLVAGAEPVPTPDEEESGGYLGVAVNAPVLLERSADDCGGYLVASECHCTAGGVCACGDCRCAAMLPKAPAGFPVPGDFGGKTPPKKIPYEKAAPSGLSWPANSPGGAAKARVERRPAGGPIRSWLRGRRVGAVEQGSGQGDGQRVMC
jgi:hypothetical protein